MTAARILAALGLASVTACASLAAPPLARVCWSWEPPADRPDLVGHAVWIDDVRQPEIGLAREYCLDSPAALLPRQFQIASRYADGTESRRSPVCIKAGTAAGCL